MFFPGPVSCTQVDCAWLIPAHVDKLTYRPLSDMDFMSAKRRKRNFDSAAAFTAPPSAGAAASSLLPSTTSLPSSSLSDPLSQPSTSTAKTTAPTDSELSDFYASLSQCGGKPALLSVISPYSDSYVSQSGVNVMPLSDLYRKGNMSFTLPELITLGEAVDVSVTESVAETIEMVTRGQSDNKDWYRYRAGRVTASRLKDVCCTDSEKPSMSLLKGICYPLESRFKSHATEWGIKNEPVALCKYKQSVADHCEVSVEQCGFVVNPDFPFMGASPDGLVSCKCCGKGVVEIKCPYSTRLFTVDEYLQSDHSCFECVNDELELKKKHKYNYQVQAQMHVCDVSFCDLVVCTFNSNVPNIFVQRIYRDDKFWDDCVLIAKRFFYVCVLPEILGRAYTRNVVDT